MVITSVIVIQIQDLGLTLPALVYRLPVRQGILNLGQPGQDTTDLLLDAGHSLYHYFFARAIQPRSHHFPFPHGIGVSIGDVSLVGVSTGDVSLVAVDVGVGVDTVGLGVLVKVGDGVGGGGGVQSNVGDGDGGLVGVSEGTNGG